MPSDFRPGLSTHHVQAQQGNGDEYGKYDLAFRPQILSQLLFCDVYAVESMRVDATGVLHLTVRYTGAATPEGYDRALCWDTQQEAGHAGLVAFQVVALPACEREEEEATA